MKRSITCLSLLALAGGAFAQTTNFTIVRPVQDARVREKVKIQFPKGSIPAGAYVGIFLNGQLIDATVPPINGKYQEYILDTKGRGLPDTPSGKPDRLEAKLYVNYNDQPRIVKTSSVDLNIANIASIKIPNSGFKLRYHFQPGTELIYDVVQRVAEDTISESQNKLGGKPAELPLDTETIRMKYAVDNAYPDGTGLVRMQAMPTKGKDYAILTVEGEQGPKKFTPGDMASIYMKLTGTGRELFGSIPLYWPMEGTSAAGNRLDLFAAFPLPTLPEKAVRPGDTWQTRFQEGKIDLTKLYSQTSVVSSFGPVRGEFVGVEWESGHPCAKLHDTISEGEMTQADKKMLAQGARFAGEKISVDETTWFALDTRQVIKNVRDITLETKTQNAAGGGYGGPGGAPGGPGGPSGGGPRANGAAGGGGASGSDVTGPAISGGLYQGRRGGQRGGGAFPGGGPPPGYGGQGNGRGGNPYGGGPGNGGMADATYIRIRFQQIFTLEG